jgi:stage V sporulation protein SpoVS
MGISNKTISRRTALRVLGGTAAVASGWLAGFFPEAQAASASGPTEIARGRTPVLRQRTGATTLATRAARAQATRKGAVARRFLAKSGFGAPESSESADVLWSDGEAIGEIDAVVFHDTRRDAYAHLIRQTTASGREVVGVALFAAADPKRRQVYDVVGDQMVFMATVTRADDGSVTVRAADGTTETVGRPTTSGAKAGLAAPSTSVYCTQVCTWQCTFVCTWVCTTVLSETCILGAFCGPLAPLCMGACIVAVIASCEWNCHNVCSLSCQWWCDVLQETAP